MANVFGAAYGGTTTAINGFTGYGLVQTISLINGGTSPATSSILTGTVMGNNNCCAITNMKLLLYTKSSSLFTSDL